MSQPEEPPQHSPHPTSPKGDVAPPKQRGFGYRPKQILIELGLLALGLLLLVLGGLWVLNRLAQQAVNFVPHEVDQSIGKMAWENMAEPRCSNPRLVRYVSDLGNRLSQHLHTDFHFTYRVVDNPAVNAFALPGGYVTVNSGLLQHAKSSEEVAAVLAHELSHVTERHGTQRVLRNVGLSAVLSLFFGGTDLQTLGQVAGQLAATAYDREEESEADALGIQLLLKARISPEGLASFFERLKSSGAPPALLSTHPDPGDRAKLAEQAAAKFDEATAAKLPPIVHGPCNR